jgi:AhpD family alkylhydroperoxidase
MHANHDSLAEFKNYREKMNRKILSSGNLQIQRFFNLDTRAYQEGALSSNVKELLGLVASLVLRCDDCITYHVIRCVEEGVSDAEFFEAFNVGLVAGGSITIPHLRRAVQRLEECRTLGKPRRSRRKRVMN